MLGFIEPRQIRGCYCFTRCNQFNAGIAHLTIASNQASTPHKTCFRSQKKAEDRWKLVRYNESGRYFGTETKIAFLGLGLDSSEGKAEQVSPYFVLLLFAWIASRFHSVVTIQYSYGYSPTLYQTQDYLLSRLDSKSTL